VLTFNFGLSITFQAAVRRTEKKLPKHVRRIYQIVDVLRFFIFLSFKFLSEKNPAY